MPSSGDVTQLLVDLREGRRDAADRLLPLVYQQLRAMAASRLAGPARDQTLSATALVHEAYLKLFDHTRLIWQDRKHFFSVAAMAMRQIIVDDARRRSASKRGGGLAPVNLDSTQIPVHDRTAEILSLDEALSRLSSIDERLARVVELRYFGGLTVEETAEVLEVDPRTVKRDWRKARAVLYQALAEPGSPPGPGDAR